MNFNTYNMFNDEISNLKSSKQLFKYDRVLITAQILTLVKKIIFSWIIFQNNIYIVISK